MQIRINGIVATKEDLIGLSPKLVKNIDFIDNPGVRYGKETGVVIDIRTYRHDSGGAVGADLSNSITAWNGNNSVFARLIMENRNGGSTTTLPIVISRVRN